MGSDQAPRPRDRLPRGAGFGNAGFGDAAGFVSRRCRPPSASSTSWSSAVSKSSFAWNCWIIPATISMWGWLVRPWPTRGTGVVPTEVGSVAAAGPVAEGAVTYPT